MLNFAEVINDEMELREMSMRKLAQESGVSESSLWCWLKGSSPKVSSLEAVLDYLGYKLDIVEK